MLSFPRDSRGREALTMNDSPRYCVVGSGATGCLCGEKLAQAGYDVTLLDIDVAIVFVDSNRTGEA